MILGIDEVGRGPWAGPLVVGAVVLGDASIKGLADSKKLSAKRREMLAQHIHEQAAAVGLGWVHADEIDAVGLSAALRLATIRAVQAIDVPYHQIILDGTINFLKDTAKGRFVTTMPKADVLIPAVSAASIVAKVARDTYMTEQDSVYPGYGFSRHVGYGTAAHRQAIDTLGVTPLHRLSFAPLRQYAINTVASRPTASSPTKMIGNQAEQCVADWLVVRGHEILVRQWRRPACEIDIVSRKDDTLYVIEVKHRRNDQYGGGIAAITPSRERQLRKAALLYQQHVGWTGRIQLAIATTRGKQVKFEDFLELE